MQHSGSHNIHSKPTRKVGFVLKPHGFNGHIRIKTDDDFQPIDFLLIEINEKFVPYKISHFNANAEIVLLDGLNSSDEVEFLCGKSILDFVTESPEVEFDFTSYQLENTLTGESYSITAVIEMPSQILIEFRVGYKDCLIPFHDDLVSEINHDLKLIKAQFPEGLLDL